MANVSSVFPSHLFPLQGAKGSLRQMIDELQRLRLEPLPCNEEAEWNELINHSEWKTLPATSTDPFANNYSLAYVALLLICTWRRNPLFAQKILEICIAHPQWNNIPATGYTGLVGIAATAARFGLVEAIQSLTLHPQWNNIPGEALKVSSVLDIHRMLSPPIINDPTNTNYGSLILIAYYALGCEANSAPHLDGHGIIPILKRHPHWPHKRSLESQALLNSAYRQWICYGHHGSLDTLPEWT